MKIDEIFLWSLKAFSVDDISSECILSEVCEQLKYVLLKMSSISDMYLYLCVFLNLFFFKCPGLLDLECLSLHKVA